MERRILTSLGIRIALIISSVAVTSSVVYCFNTIRVPVSVETPFMYESEFPQGELGVLNTSYWVVDPQLISGADCIERGMLNNCVQ